MRMLYCGFPRFYGGVVYQVELQNRAEAAVLNKSCLLAIAGVILCTSFSARAQSPATQPSFDRQKLEQDLARTLSNAVLVGHYDVDGQRGALKEDHYTLGAVKKMAGDLWLIPARIQYGQQDVTVPIMVPILWAGDTPIIMVTDMGLPGMAKYTARVMIYGDRYVGTWSAGARHGGILFGRVTHPPTTQPAQPPASP